MPSKKTRSASTAFSAASTSLPAPRGPVKNRKSPTRSFSRSLKELKKNTKSTVRITYAKKIGGLTWLEREIEEARNTPEFITHGAVLDVTEEIVAIMETDGLTRTELARRAGLAPAQITRFLNGDHNMTVRTLGRLAAALGKQLKISIS